jgi:uncharacterized protein YjiS (DUF1127 family)
MSKSQLIHEILPFESQGNQANIQYQHQQNRRRTKMAEIYLTSYHAQGKWQFVVEKVRHAIDTWRTRARGRRLLARMTEYQLQDIGLTAAARDQEASKMFWQL